MCKEAKKEKGMWQCLFFPGIILYGELLLRIFDTSMPFFSIALLRIALFSGAAGLGVYLLLSLIPKPGISRIAAICLIILGSVYLCVAYCCHRFFGTYFTVGYMAQMTADAVGDFSQNFAQVILGSVLFILLAFLPLVGFILLRRRFFAQKTIQPVILLVAFVAVQAGGSVLSANGEMKNYYTYDFQANPATREFGVLTTLRLEAQYAIFGLPEAPPVILELPPASQELGPVDLTGESFTQPSVEPTTDSEVEEAPEETEEPKVYGYNALPINFAELIENTSSDTMAAAHQYFGSSVPSQQNEYTGYFQGKNLILITAEAFSPYVISEELTPTLYKLANESFVFTDYYQPDWQQSTAGGEFAVLTGLIPTWVNSGLALNASSRVSMPYTLGWAFQELGYSALAYHNNSYTYYDRHKSHPNMGYEWTAIGNGLHLEHDYWPNSDLEMIQATADAYIQNYVENGVNFHTYYMTVSGHANYNWGGNRMCAKNKEIAQAAYPNASTAVQAYIACNLELEYAMACLIEKLEAAGIADDTVIVLTTDHYPYALNEGWQDYYKELSGINDSVNQTSRYKNTLIIWNGAMEERVVVDTPCSSIDIVPTLCNLFGITYDSRLYSGRDVFATNYLPDQVSTCMPLVVLPIGNGYSWITAAGTYEASTGVFTPKKGITVSDDYVDYVSQLASAKYSYARFILQKDYYGIIEEALSENTP